MLQLQEEIFRAGEATEAVRRDLAKVACREYFLTLGPAKSPSKGDFAAARAKALSVLKGGLLAGKTLSIINGGTKYDEKTQAKLALAFDAIAPALVIPQAPVARNPKVLTQAIAALAGAFGGAVGLAPLLRWAFDANELGVVLGGPLGACLLVLLVDRLSRIRALLRFLPGAGSGLRLRGAARKEHETVVAAAVEQYLDWAVLTLTVLCAHESGGSESQGDREKAFRRVGKLIYALHRSRRESLPVAADELIKEAKNCGFEGLEGAPAFAGESQTQRDEVVWSKTLQSKYETFGHIVEGDRVTVERLPVVFSGKVVERGLVRKVRDKA